MTTRRRIVMTVTVLACGLLSASCASSDSASETSPPTSLDTSSIATGSTVTGSTDTGSTDAGSSDAVVNPPTAPPSAPSTAAPVATTATTTTAPSGIESNPPELSSLTPEPALPCRAGGSAGGTVPTTVRMWSVLNEAAKDTLRQQVVDFNLFQDEVELDLEYEATPDAILERLGAGERPDLLVIGVEGLVNLTDAGLVTNVQACIDTDTSFDRRDLLPVAAASYQLRDVQVAMPLTVSTPVLYYDRNLFSAAGLDPDRPPTTLAELRDDLARLVESGVAASGLTYGDAAFFVSQWAAQLGVELADGGNGHGEIPTAGPQVSLDDPELQAVLEELQAMANDGLVTKPKIKQFSFDDLIELLDEDAPAAMAFHTSGSASAAYDLVGSLKNRDAEVGIAPLPGPGVGGTVGGSAMWITTDDPDRVWPAWLAISYLIGPASQSAFGALGYAPVRLSTLDDPDLQAAWFARPGLRVGFDQLVATTPEPAHLPLAVGTQANVSWRLNWAGEDIIDISRNHTVAEALSRAEHDIGMLLGSYNRMRYGPS